MATPPPPSLENDLSSSAYSDERSPLLQRDRESVQYGVNGATEVDGTSRVTCKTREERQSSEGGHLLPKSSGDPPSKSKPTLSSLLFSPLHRTCRTLTGGRCDEVSLRLQNSGSVARDHLALERTFLAYMRTSLAIASAGVALVQLFNTSNKAETDRIEKFARPLGASVIALGLIVLGVGLIRYFVVQSALIKGYFPVARIVPVFFTVGLTSLVSIVFWLLVSGRLEF